MVILAEKMRQKLISGSSSQEDAINDEMGSKEEMQDWLLRVGSVDMSFIMEFAENLILRMMEDPVERDRKFREHVYHMKERCTKTKEMWGYPIRPYGFWTFDRHNAQINQVEGRRDPYDDLLQDQQTEASSSSK
ncbi:hypothetical protein CTI12_AA543820 [Artemisia annua]|uniref:Uncharacterized protein n=1 Tax=Artemisia annua TaxID=35608 RepID=A0A2U1L0H3_ARTAN|nr:hypothetical protein CTI12_AA543820 [Artemisia annua]